MRSFLNAVSTTDTFHRLYNSQMQEDDNGGITRSGTNQNDFQYGIKPGMEKKPVNFVSLFDAMRFCNWLHNGGQDDSDTETGAYRLLREMDKANLKTVTRNPSARVFLPTEDEWHKSAFFVEDAPNKPSQSFWTFATSSDELATGAAIWNSTGPSSVGTGLQSSYGTFDQSGNLAEWTETFSSDRDGKRVVRGGSWKSTEPSELSKTGYELTDSESEIDARGFRLAFAYDANADSSLYQIRIPVGWIPPTYH